MSFLIDAHVFLVRRGFGATFPPGARSHRGRESGCLCERRLLLGNRDQTARRQASVQRVGALGSAAGLLELDIDAADAETAGALDWDHRDPFDRMLVAHCLNRSLTLVTVDARLRARSDIAVFWAG